MQLRGLFEYMRLPKLFGVAVVCILFTPFFLNAATIHTYSDRLSDSAPSESSNHTIQFTTTVPIPPGGYIRFTPEDGEFTIPVLDFDTDNVALYVNSILRSSTSTANASDDGVSITTGTSGNIELTLNSSTGISAGATVRLLIGNHTPNSTTTDSGILNPGTSGTYEYFIATGGGASPSQVTGKYAIIENVHIDDVDTTETDPPLRFNGAPMGVIAGTVSIVEMSVETNEFARCRYSTASGTPYAAMTLEFNPNFRTVHSKELPVATSTQYDFFVRCIDDEGNVNIDDYVISFIVEPSPQGTPSDDPGDSGGDGSGSGSGTGSGGSGGGSSSGGSSGGGSGAGGSGGDDGGGFELDPRPYQSGDGEVTVTGYAFPRSQVVILVDGNIADSTNADSEGEFSITLEEIARGAYSFGIYGIDRNGTKSSTFSTTFTVTGSRASTLSNINVMPSIKVSPDPAQSNSTVTVSGYAIPDATITLEHQNDRTSASLKTFTALSDANGAWSISVSTNGLAQGTYKVRAKAKQETGASTNFSNYTFYGIGQSASVPRSSDLNRDGKVNLTDFSILIFWWGSAGGNSNPPADINQNGRVGLEDFSILLFNWTG